MNRKKQLGCIAIFEEKPIILQYYFGFFPEFLPNSINFNCYPKSLTYSSIKKQEMSDINHRKNRLSNVPFLRETFVCILKQQYMHLQLAARRSSVILLFIWIRNKILYYKTQCSRDFNYVQTNHVMLNKSEITETFEYMKKISHGDDRLPNQRTTISCCLKPESI